MIKITKKKTHEELIQEVYKLVGNEYEILELYKGSKVPILFKHNTLCQHKFLVRPGSFLWNNTRCPKCNGGVKKTHEEFIKEVYDLVGEEYIVKEKYINARTKLLMKHNICGCEWSIDPDHFLRGQRCPKCANNFPYTTETFKEKVFELVGNEYDVLGEYISANIKIPIRHNICNYKYETTPAHFLNDRRCSKCANNLKYTIETFKEKIKKLVKDEYEVLSKYYKNNKTKILMKHNLCNNKYFITPDSFLRGTRCPICNESKGEQRVRRYLEVNNIIFKPQYTFEDCRRIEVLPFDFAIFNNDKNLNYLIEYDGEYHYIPIEGENKLKYQQERDEIKNKYCIDNNIQLIRIPYWEFENIENILETKLVNL